MPGAESHLEAYLRLRVAWQHRLDQAIADHDLHALNVLDDEVNTFFKGKFFQGGPSAWFSTYMNGGGGPPPPIPLYGQTPNDFGLANLELWSGLVRAAVRRVEAELEDMAKQEPLLRLKQEHELAIKDKEIEIKRLELEIELAKIQQASQQRQEERNHELQVERTRAELDRMKLGMTQPFELQRQLSSLILAAWEKQERDPSAKATFGNLEEIITRASTATTNLTRDLDADGNPLDNETRKRAAAEALELVMKLADRLISRL